MEFTIAVELELDGRWIAEIAELPGVMCYGPTPEEAIASVNALARLVADELANG